jgi:hypothetical protein
MFKLTKSVDQVIFDVVLFVFFSGLAIISSGYKTLARELPMPVAIIGGLLSLLLVLTDIFPYLHRKLKFINLKPLQLQGMEKLGYAENSHSHPTSWRKTGRSIVWLVLYVLAIQYIGYLVATFCFVTLLTLLEGGLKLRTSLFSGLGSTAFFYVIFNLILNAPF